MVSIGIISRDATYGNGAALAEGMRSFTDVSVWFRFEDKKELYRQTKVVESFPDCDRYIIIGAISLSCFPKKYYNRKVTVIFTDSTYMNNAKKYNKIVADNKWSMFAMPDLVKFSDTKNIYYQPFIIPEVDKSKTNLICHSPFCGSKEIQKGTSLISAICVKNNLPLTIIKDKTWRETIEIKASHLICVDQLFRGIGKSGLEAMLLNCAVLTGEKPEGDNLPPVIWTNKKKLNDDLVSLIFNKYRLKEVVSKQREWAVKNLDPEYVAGRIFETL